MSQRGEKTQPRSRGKWQVCVAPNARVSPLQVVRDQWPRAHQTRGPGPRKYLIAGYTVVHLFFIETE